ncbi:BRO-N domain-containing protein [Bacillus sonorensis]|uniref:BRO-N domain-containing protein n=1 Tax=Bacillus sonorensis TaxID=119858 RepID=UPI001F1E85AA|nr:Bro-N domain-containing protein [Bacillus sonorensis]MCF7618687.1 Bro-N domain-containing protein [Bacillus sonorensis]MCY7858909.1 Bro-N domain-containing protein [Bacillus sonorensis]MCY8034018.1 Bro-N domain-containing protein [Bacillus sonorensis]
MNQFEKVFNYKENKVRTLTKDGEICFVAKDVCEILEIKNTSDALSRLDDDEKATIGLTDSGGRPYKQSVVNEAGLYSLILSSRKPEAKQFKRWVTHEVLPSIRINGMYVADDATREQKLFNYDMLEETFSNCGIENLHDLYKECIDYYKKNKIRLDYKRSSKNRRQDKKKSITDSRIEVMKKIESVLMERELRYKKNLNFAFVSVVSDLLKIIALDIKSIKHNKTRGKLAKSKAI